MAKRPVVEIKCSRCERVEHQASAGESPAVATPVFSASLSGIVVNWEDLCTPCFNTVRGHLDAIGKKIEGVSPTRQKRSKDAQVLHLEPAAKKKAHG